MTLNDCGSLNDKRSWGFSHPARSIRIAGKGIQIKPQHHQEHCASILLKILFRSLLNDFLRIWKKSELFLKKAKIGHVSVRTIGGFSFAIFRKSYSGEDRRDRNYINCDFCNYLDCLYQYYTGLPKKASEYNEMISKF